MNKLNREIKTNSKAKVDENENTVVDISLPRLILSSVNAMDKKDLEKAMKKRQPLTALKINKPIE